MFSTSQLKEDSRTGAVTSWCHAPKNLVLRSGEVHVWRIALNAPAARIQSLKQVLAVDEQARAERFYFQKDRDHFIIARGTLRCILGRYLHVKPADLRFCYSPYGKPALTKEFADVARFNLSHSHGLALFAITRRREIGIDIEHIRAGFADDNIAERFFSPCEVEVLRALPVHMQQEAFFNCWTRKEAYIKAHGKGLSLSLDRFDVSFVPGKPAALLSTSDDPNEASRWSLQELFPGPGYTAALAVEGSDWQLKRWQWQE